MDRQPSGIVESSHYAAVEACLLRGLRSTGKGLGWAQVISRPREELELGDVDGNHGIVCPLGVVRALRGVGAINYVTGALVEAFMEWHHIAWEMPLAQGAGCLEDVGKCVREPDCSRDHN
jgi:hypothetical protein